MNRAQALATLADLIQDPADIDPAAIAADLHRARRADAVATQAHATR